MPNSNRLTERLIAQAKLGEEAALVDLIGQLGPRLRQAIDAELEAVQHDLDATQMWNEIQDEAKRRVSEFEGTTETEFKAWAERLALRHIRYSVGGRAGNIETVVNAPKTEFLPEPARTSEVTGAAEVAASTTADPNATIAPHNIEAANYDPNATIAPGDGDTISPHDIATLARDPHATITNLAAIPLAPQATKIFGDYEILETIAKGGMGVVYKARQRKLNRIVALKMILAGQFADQGDIDRFYAEAQAAAHLRHPNIVGIHEVGECEGQHYFSMEYIEGKSLGDLVREHPLAPRNAAKFVKTVSEAMHYAHEEGVLHRDLKPSNVLVDENDVPLVTDFGLAKRTAEQSQLTVAGTVLGTPSYMPPEQASGKLDQISVRSDVYSLGAILYELITGKPPFGAANPWETIKQVLSNEPVSPRLLNSGVPADLETICLKCLQKDQVRRYQSAQDLAEELQRFLAGEPILARPIGIVERSLRWCYRNPWPTAALGVLLLGVVGTSAGLKIARDAQHEAEIAQSEAEMSRDQLLDAINKLFTAWSDVTLINEPGFEDVRKELLATASDLYEQMGTQLGADPKIQKRLGESYFRLGRLMFNFQSYDNSRKSLEKGLKIQRELDAASPGEEEPLHALGESLNLYGNVLEVTATGPNNAPNESQKHLEEAEGVYEDVIEKRQKLADAIPDKPEYKRQLLNSRMNHGMVQQRMGRSLDDHGDRLFDEGGREEAEASYRAAEKFYEVARRRVELVQPARHELLERLAESSGIRDDVVHDLAQGYYNLAKLTKRLGDYVATDEYLAAAVGEFDTLLDEYPKHLEYQYDQAACWMLVGEAKFEQRLDSDQDAMRKTFSTKAIEAYKSAEVILKRMASKSTSVPKYRRDLAYVYLQIGEIHFLDEQDKEALDAYRSADTILTPMVGEFPDDMDLRNLLEQAKRGMADVIPETADTPPATSLEEAK
ncbi:MAG: serine/threonine-protein kinase [Planctomycetota bacterium]|nr:serine/threonine-protein kinase [Planctomycetota bacterium]